MKELLRGTTSGRYLIDRQELNYCEFEDCIVFKPIKDAAAIYFDCDCAPITTKEGNFHEDCFEDYLEALCNNA